MRHLARLYMFAVLILTGLFQATVAHADPLLTVSATNVAGGSSVTVTLTNGAGGQTDWLAFAASSSSNTSYVQWTYVGNGVTTRTWTVTTPTTGGSFEFRLLLNNGYTVAATSPTVVVGAVLNISAVSTSTGEVGQAITISGSAFGSSQGTSTVRFNGTIAGIVSWTATNIIAIIPIGATSGPLIVTVNGIASNGVTFAPVSVKPCPSGPTTVPYTGSLDSGASRTIDVSLAPCETLTTSLTLNPPASGIAWAVKFLNESSEWLDQDQGTCYSDCSQMVPRPTNGVIPATKGVRGRPAKIQLFNSYSYPVAVSYTLTVTKTPRPGYNLGGTSPATAALLSTTLPTTIRASLAPIETETGGSAQYFKVRLWPGGTITVSGTVHRWAGYGTSFQVRVLNANLQIVSYLAGAAAYAPNPTPIDPGTFTYIGETAADFYVKVASANDLLHDVTMSIAMTIDGHTSTTLAGFRLTMNAFAPYNYISDPHPIFGSNRILETDGNNRPFSENGSSRISEIMDLWHAYRYPTSPVFLSEPIDWANITEQYELSSSVDVGGNITTEAKNDWILGTPLKTDWGVPFNRGTGCAGSRFNSSVSIVCDVETANGVYTNWIEPQIEFKVTLTFNFGSTTSVTYGITGCHKFFPAYEIWAAGQAILTHLDSGNPYDILIACELAVPVNQSGVITVP